MATLYTYEILDCWGPAFEDSGFGYRIVASCPPDEDGYCLFEGEDGGWEGRLVASREVGGIIGAALTTINELNGTEEGREILQEAYRGWKEQKDEQGGK